MKHIDNLPHYRIDNIYAWIGSLFVLLITLGSFFIYLNRLTIVETKQDTILANQQEQHEMWLKLESRVGILEIASNINSTEHSEIMRALKIK